MNEENWLYVILSKSDQVAGLSANAHVGLDQDLRTLDAQAVVFLWKTWVLGAEKHPKKQCHGLVVSHGSRARNASVS